MPSTSTKAGEPETTTNASSRARRISARTSIRSRLRMQWRRLCNGGAHDVSLRRAALFRADTDPLAGPIAIPPAAVLLRGRCYDRATLTAKLAALR
jgi:hypothetical protein